MSKIKKINKLSIQKLGARLNSTYARGQGNSKYYEHLLSRWSVLAQFNPDKLLKSVNV